MRCHEQAPGDLRKTSGIFREDIAALPGRVAVEQKHFEIAVGLAVDALESLPQKCRVMGRHDDDRNFRERRPERNAEQRSSGFVEPCVTAAPVGFERGPPIPVVPGIEEYQPGSGRLRGPCVRDRGVEPATIVLQARAGVAERPMFAKRGLVAANEHSPMAPDRGVARSLHAGDGLRDEHSIGKRNAAVPLAWHHAAGFKWTRRQRGIRRGRRSVAMSLRLACGSGARLAGTTGTGCGPSR